MRACLPIVLVACLSVSACSWNGPGPRSPDLDSADGLPPSSLDRAELPFGAQGPTVAGGIPSGFAPPVGQCRVWLPAATLGDQPDPTVCSRAKSHIPLGALLVHTPSDGVVQVTTYDDLQPDLIVGIASYDLATGDRVDVQESAGN